MPPRQHAGRTGQSPPTDPGPGRPRRRQEGDSPQTADAIGAVLRSVGEDGLTILLDANLPIEQLTAAADWCWAWPNTNLCLLIEPADEQLLLGAEASGADYLADSALADCDGFLVIGDAFSAAPACARGLLDRRRAESRTVIAAIDPGAGTASKFASHPVGVAPGGELAALAAVAKAAGLEVLQQARTKLGGQSPFPQTAAEMGTVPSAAIAAGKALARCRRPAVLIAAEYGRSGDWQGIGLLAGRLAKHLGGGLLPLTAGANALAALRSRKSLGAIPLGEALAGRATLRRGRDADGPDEAGRGSKRDESRLETSPSRFVAIGCDPIGLLGRPDLPILAAAAALPNASTAVAEVVLPIALADEIGGTWLLAGENLTQVAALIPPPAGVPTPADLVGALAKAAGVVAPAATAPLIPMNPAWGPQDRPVPLRRLVAQPVEPSPLVETRAAAAKDAANPAALLFGRQTAHAGCGALTSHGAWQAAAMPLPELRLAPQDARRHGITRSTVASVRVNGRSVDVRVRIAPELSEGRMVLSEGFSAARALAPCTADGRGGLVAAVGPDVRIEPI